MGDFDIAGTFNLDRDQSLRLAELRIRINEDGHDVPVDDVDARHASGTSGRGMRPLGELTVVSVWASLA